MCHGIKPKAEINFFNPTLKIAVPPLSTSQKLASCMVVTTLQLQLQLQLCTLQQLFSEESCSVHVGLSKQLRLQLRQKLLATVVW